MSFFSLGDAPFDQMKALQELLYPKKDSSDDSSDEEFERQRQRKMGPADLASKVETKKVEKLEKKEEKKPIPKELRAEDKDEIDEWLEKQHKEDTDILETRKCPEYTISYKQSVGTEDVFLGINNRTPGSMSCEDMVIEIKMPDETISVEAMDLEVAESSIDLKTTVYRLKLPLIHPIDPDKGTARFDVDKKSLILTLRMKREFDFAHF